MSGQVFHLHLHPLDNTDNAKIKNYRHNALQQNCATPVYRCGDFEATQAPSFSTVGGCGYHSR